MTKSTLRTVVLVMLIAAAGLYLYTDQQRQRYQQTAAPAVSRILTDISSWEKDILIGHLAAETRQVLTDQQLQKLLTHYQQFGQLQSIGELHYSRIMGVFSLFGDTRINYSGTAVFASGPANINITLTPHGSGFLIYNFTLSSQQQ